MEWILTLLKFVEIYANLEQIVKNFEKWCHSWVIDIQVRLILLPRFVAFPFIHFCTKYPPPSPMYIWSLLEQWYITITLCILWQYYQHIQQFQIKNLFIYCFSSFCRNGVHFFTVYIIVFLQKWIGIFFITMKVHYIFNTLFAHLSWQVK